MDLISNVNQIRLYFEMVLPAGWKETEAAFVSLAARKKYAGNDSGLDFGHSTQMLAREVVKRPNVEEYVAKVRRFTAEGSFLDMAGHVIPTSAMVVYVNIHLSDAVKAWNRTKQEMTRIDEEAMTHLYQGGGDLSHVSRQMRNLGGIWLTQMQNSYSGKRWLDFDVDLLDPLARCEAHGQAMDVLHGMGIAGTVTIHTRGGFHLLVSSERNIFNKDVNPVTIRSSLEDVLKDATKEVAINRNGMVPLPGTRQGGHAVIMEIDKV